MDFSTMTTEQLLRTFRFHDTDIPKIVSDDTTRARIAALRANIERHAP